MHTKLKNRPAGFASRFVLLAGFAYTISAAPALAQSAANQGAGTTPPATNASPSAVSPSADGSSGSVQPPANTPVTAQGKRVRAQVEQRIADLHRRLHITQAEEPLWNDFANTMRQNAAEMDQLFQQRQQTVGTMNAVDDMKSYAQLAQAHAEQMQHLIPAFEKLYDAMPPEQKKLTDQEFRRFQQQMARERRP